ncbi:MAG: hypothetical protein BMS9Abin25_0301 [Gammaproteobacteria bacterium]|nr:MAG: hypothetical protein BMS9Abin25_0301 [Gammaproteobacteria bacterium]
MTCLIPECIDIRDEIEPEIKDYVSMLLLIHSKGTAKLTAFSCTATT